VRFADRRFDAYPQLVAAAARDVGGNLYASADSDDADLLGALVLAGFIPEMEAERFQIRFDKALGWLNRARVPSTFGVEPANRVDVDRLVALDNIIRDDVPGTDGWHADRSWIHDELSDAPPFDPAAYLVAIHEPSGEFAGLVRMWRNPAGPRLGLVGVLGAYRRTTLAAGLLKRSILAASEWGHDSFVTETSLSNRVIYQRMAGLGAASLGRFRQLVLRNPGGRRGYGTISTGHGA